MRSISGRTEEHAGGHILVPKGHGLTEGAHLQPWNCSQMNGGRKTVRPGADNHSIVFLHTFTSTGHPGGGFLGFLDVLFGIAHTSRGIDVLELCNASENKTQVQAVGDDLILSPPSVLLSLFWRCRGGYLRT